jgi:hypothetical protein
VGVGGNNVTISSTGSRGGMEIGIVHHQHQMQASGVGTGTQGDEQGLSRYSGAGQQGGGAGSTDRQQTDPSVWRPY